MSSPLIYQMRDLSKLGLISVSLGFFIYKIKIYQFPPSRPQGLNRVIYLKLLASAHSDTSNTKSWVDSLPLEPWACEAHQAGAKQTDFKMQNLNWLWVTYRSAHFITNPKVKTTLFIHRVVDSRKFWEFGPIMFKRVIEETVVGTVKRKVFHVIKCFFVFCFFLSQSVIILHD